MEEQVQRKPTLCVDFDGVIHSYESGWQGAGVVDDPPVPGAIRWLWVMTQDFDVCIYSSRSKSPEGVDAMRSWLEEWGQQAGLLAGWTGYLSFPTQKPAAFLTIDDRAICFRGSFEELTADNLLSFKPWNREEPPDA